MAYGADQIWVALSLTMVGGLATAVGGLLVVLQPTPDVRRLGVMQGLAAGLMLCLSFFDLLPGAIHKIGFKLANLWFFAGVLFFWAVVQFIPEPSLDQLAGADEEEEEAPRSRGVQDGADMQGAAVADGGDAGLRRRRGPDAPAAERPSLSPPPDKKPAFGRHRVLYSGIITAIGISLHNFPEGIAVFLGSLKGLRVGLTLAVAIALHNIPEGVAVALPIYYGTGSRAKAFWLAAFSGLAEPLAVVAVAVLFPSQLSEETIEGLLAAVGGIMAFLVLHEMLPLAFAYAGHKPAVVAVFVGMAAMSLSLWFLGIALPPELA
ncbi:Zinc transporter and related ZIP domain-containing proteins [Klebsormidium nitens]|uniref:Zinc transporter and related ZIP domain-containing proteins n=1 Tax=Klebsormidium nitens TaxID=105231 RepID=A0A1Y1HWT9_KLENI|nr:Zinc transporter and related ZIP domain-containing proteins [Klebsormidium nitens]|eukprot:GAQ82623.1 Zinc transporter and related ZIP domain-containing proteins [Klebsormidium nitens]